VKIIGAGFPFMVEIEFKKLENLEIHNDAKWFLAET